MSNKSVVPKSLTVRTMLMLKNEIALSQIKHGDSSMLQLRPDLDNYGYRLAILIEEVGEVGKAICEGSPRKEIVKELVQVAAMAMSWADAENNRALAEAQLDALMRPRKGGHESS